MPRAVSPHPGSARAPEPASATPPAFALLEGGFRPFFLAAGAWAAAALGLWLGAWLGLLELSATSGAAPWAGSWWHAHEMLFGMVAAAAAGFLLTAVPVWTGTPPFRGAPLAGLVALWTAGRVANAAAGALPPALVLGVDVAFLPVLALVVGRRIAAAGRPRQAPFPLVLLVLAGLDAAVHLHAAGAQHLLPAPAALRAAVDLAVLLVALVGGRITPTFTGTALRRAGDGSEVRPGTEWGALGLAALVALAVADLAAPRSVWSGAAAGVAAAALALRHLGWRPLRAARDPLLLALHLGMLWVPLGLALVAASDLGLPGGPHGGPLPPASGLHALTAGAIGTTILAVMTRVGLGHTGRPLVAPRAACLAYALAHAGALLRVASPLAPPSAYATLVTLGGTLWAAAFLVFAVAYTPILGRPRVDGRPG